MGGTNGRPCPEEESRGGGRLGQGWGRRGQKGGKIETGLEEKGAEAERGGAPKGGHSGEEPEGGVTQRKIAGVVLEVGDLTDGSQTNPRGRCPRDAEDQVGSSPKSLHFQGTMCVVWARFVP